MKTEQKWSQQPIKEKKNTEKRLIGTARDNRRPALKRGKTRVTNSHFFGWKDGVTFLDKLPRELRKTKVIVEYFEL